MCPLVERARPRLLSLWFTAYGVRCGATGAKLHGVDGMTTNNQGGEAAAITVKLLVHSFDPLQVFEVAIRSSGEFVVGVEALVEKAAVRKGVPLHQVAHLEFAGVWAGARFWAAGCKLKVFLVLRG